jgi:hypothetical protein
MYETAARPSLEELTNVSLQSRLLCHCIFVRCAADSVGIYTRVQQYSPQSEVSITFEDKHGQIIFGFRSDTAVEITQAFQRFRVERP